ncbi:hypothetical protein ACLBXM_23350 [Xanthobacteraceae bacterium A53D]
MRSILLAATVVAVAGAGSVSAQTLTPEQAKAFVVGRSFAFTCFEGSTGAGRIFADGSVAGTLTQRAQGIARYVRLPANTVRMREDNVCGFIEGMTFEPCFTVTKTSATTFRGTLAGVDSMWCEFVREGSDRTRMVQRRSKPKAENSTAVTMEKAGD